MKKPRSNLVTAALAGGSLYWVSELSRSGRGVIDWTLIGLLGLAVGWVLLALAILDSIWLHRKERSAIASGALTPHTRKT